MRIEEPSVSQLKYALKDPSVLSLLGTMTPVLANMNDQEFYNAVTALFIGYHRFMICMETLKWRNYEDEFQLKETAMKKTNIEQLADVYKYFVRLKPSAKELNFRPFVQPAGAIYPRKGQFTVERK